MSDADPSLDLDPELTEAPAVLARFKRALTLSMLAVVVLGAIFFLQRLVPNLQPYSLQPQVGAGLVGVLTAPLLHGSFEHLASNAFAILILGTIAGSLFPRASRAALPVVWIGSGLGTWFISLGGNHIGASGVTVGLMFFLIAQGLRRRDRMSLTGLMLALFFFGGMVLSVLPQEAGVSWEYHLSGAVVGFICGLAFAGWDERAPERLYSWDLEPENDDADTELQLPKAQDVPVLWHRPEPRIGDNVLPFKRPDS
jgi:membrane associated rhomboid family serine protease